MKQIIQNLPFDLSLKQEIENSGIMKTLPENSCIIREGQYVKHIPLLIKGKIRVFKIEPDLDREILLYYVGKGETCMMTVFSVYQNRKSRVHGITTEDSEMLLIPIEYVQKWQSKYPDWNKYLINGFEERYSNLLDAFEAVSFHKIDERLENYLKKYSDRNETLIIPFSHQQIANELGTTRVVVSRILKEMEAQNRLTLHRGYIKLIKK